MSLVKIGGYSIVCHIVVELRILRRPNARKITSGDALTRESTIPFDRPAGAMAGARATNKSTLSFSVG